MQQNETMHVGMVTIMVVVIIFGGIFVLQGMDLHKKVVREEMQFHELQTQYYSIEKQVRDEAPTNSMLTKQLTMIQNYPSSLMSMKLIGVGKILTGICIVLIGILFALLLMPLRLYMMIQPQPMPTPKKKSRTPKKKTT
ncbi:MAG: hypothetical protein GW775_01720 [Candidatus Magasanikbacteria bacterium]|uniref:Uncharacterized protein n=1 Tax=Candidatus Magasanikbacteria bacterium CG10_big_fil_rev_8_21_14_0_10_38_6 TaxID=1974647 RepID=A0A2M6P258_9BACT|nr:hypothetical protein [bacterium]NCS71969.1 hypothetical protein [Candidatus Magasanikbacteria bacterium]PIR77781.1 MAG: hypothetical protein COU30_00610 [Candidatus Magasanikbacteria bacterium CG10_big_fil_rev_8_21_14_0_10_38_6]